MGQVDTRGKWTYLSKIQILMYVDRVLLMFLFCLMKLWLRNLINTKSWLNMQTGESYQKAIETIV